MSQQKTEQGARVALAERIVKRLHVFPAPAETMATDARDVESMLAEWAYALRSAESKRVAANCKSAFDRVSARLAECEKGQEKLMEQLHAANAKNEQLAKEVAGLVAMLEKIAALDCCGDYETCLSLCSIVISKEALDTRREGATK